MICSVVKKETLTGIEGGQRAISFRDSAHWRKRITLVHKAIMLLSGGRCRVHSIERIESTGGGFVVHLGAEWNPPKQQGLFNE